MDCKGRRCGGSALTALPFLNLVSFRVVGTCFHLQHDNIAAPGFLPLEMVRVDRYHRIVLFRQTQK